MITVNDFNNVVNLFCLKVILDKVDFMTWLHGFELFLEAQDRVTNQIMLNKLVQALELAKVNDINSTIKKNTYNEAMTKLIDFQQQETITNKKTLN